MNMEERKKVKGKLVFDYLVTVFYLFGLMFVGFVLTIIPSNFLFMIFGFLTGLVLLLWTLDLMEKYRYKYKGIDE